LNLVEQICAVLGNEAALEVLGMLPQDLNPIELRTVGRQIVQIQSAFGPLSPFLLHRSALVNAGIVDQDDARYRVRLKRNLLEECDNIVVCRRPLLSVSNQLAIMTQGSKNIYALSVRERFDGPGLADPGLAILHRRIRLKPDSLKYSNSHRCSWSSLASASITSLAPSNST